MRRGSPLSFDVSRFPTLPRVRGIFVTGTDTEVGKTLVAGAIARNLRRGGKNVEVFKPVATGCRRGRGGLISADGEFLAACADSSRMLAEITPLRFKTALSPNVAAQREGRTVDLQAIFDAYAGLAAAGPDCVVIEGIGGLLCPIADDFWVIHFAKLTALPLVIVTRPGLGTINHTLLTIHAARSAGLKVAGVVINRYRLEPDFAAGRGEDQIGIEVAGGEPRGQNVAAATACPPTYEHGDEDLAIFTNPAQISKLGRTEILAIVPEEAANSVAKSTIGPNTQFAIDQMDWFELM
jgi:dethiobiotin synthetase